jgi:hypothetical protein
MIDFFSSIEQEQSAAPTSNEADFFAQYQQQQYQQQLYQQQMLLSVTVYSSHICLLVKQIDMGLVKFNSINFSNRKFRSTKEHRNLNE